MLKAVVVAISLLSATTAAADSRADAAATWVEAAFRGKTPTLTTPFKLVFDSGTVFAADSPCAKLRVTTIKTAAELASFTGCVRQAAVKLALDKRPAVPAKDLREVDARYLEVWFAKRFHSQITGRRLIGTVFERHLPNVEATGVAVMLYVDVDSKNQVTTAYAYAGHWAYPE